MTEDTHININGKYFKKSTATIYSNNRAFLYGDGIFETMHANGTEIQFFDDHYNRIINGMQTLKLNVDDKFRKDSLRKNIIDLLNKNKFYKGTRIRLTIFRSSGGLYTPTTNEASYLIDSSPLTKDKYELNKKGLTIDVFHEIKKSINKLSNLKTINSLVFVLSGIYKTEKAIDDCLILNEKNEIIESISSNIFIIKNENIYTPPISSGCVDGIMRKQIIRAALDLNLNIIDDHSILPENLLEVDEILLTNAISGINWVVAYKQRRYFNTIAKKLISQLNYNAFNS